jgi:dihydrofolate reductase
MAKLVTFDMISVDGYFAAENGDIGWHTVDDAFNDYALNSLQSIGTILFGRITYELFESYWPQALRDPATDPADRLIAEAIDQAHKVVVSRTRHTSDWQHTTFMSELTAGNINQLKQAAEKDIMVYGSGCVVQQLTDLGLVDEFRLMVSPTLLGTGKSLFDGVKQLSLQLQEERSFASNSNVLLVYRPA